jgi:hypothetical protein
MRILGEYFYDMQTHWKEDFSPHMVDVVTMQECEIQTVDVETNEIVDTSMVYVVVAVLKNGVFAATKPLDDEGYAKKVAETLIQYCEDVAHGN